MVHGHQRNIFIESNYSFTTQAPANYITPPSLLRSPPLRLTHPLVGIEELRAGVAQDQVEDRNLAPLVHVNLWYARDCKVERELRTKRGLRKKRREEMNERKKRRTHRRGCLEKG